MTYNDLIQSILADANEYLDECLHADTEPECGDFGIYLMAKHTRVAPAEQPCHKSDPDEFMQELLVRLTEYVVGCQSDGGADATQSGFGEFLYGEYDDHDFPLDARTVIARAQGEEYNGWEDGE